MTMGAGMSLVFSASSAWAAPSTMRTAATGGILGGILVLGEPLIRAASWVPVRPDWH